MTPTEKIRKFGTYHPLRLEALRSDLSLSMSTAFLQHCANYFRTRTRRDPSADELRMLDRFAFLKQGDPSRLSPVELYTNDPFVAETYADMMKKRGELRPDTKAPMSLVDALSLANDYLARAGKKPVYVTPHSLVEEVSFQTGALGANTVVASSGIAQRNFLANPLPAQSNDLFWLLLPNAKKAQALPALMSDPSLGRIFKMLRKVEKDGVLSALLTMTNGAWIDLNRLARTQENPPLAPLTDAYAGAYLVRVPRENEKALQQLAASYAVYPLLFATATEGGEITFGRSQKDFFTIESAFLHSLSPLSPITAKLQGEKIEELISPDQAPVAVQRSAYLCRESIGDSRVSPLFEDYTCSLATANLHSSFFLNAFYTALLAVVNQTLGGSHYSDQVLSVCLQAPKNALDPKSASACISSAIGVYRLQAELGLTAKAPAVRTGKEELPVLTVFSSGRGGAIPSALQSEGNLVYCLTPAIGENGLPNFDELRTTLDRLSKLRESGILASAYAVCGESLRDALTAVEADHHFCALESAELDLLITRPIAILLETTCECVGLTLLGRVCKQAAEQSLDTEPTLSPIRSLIPSDRTELVIFAAENDRDADLLTSLLNQRGAHAICQKAIPQNETPLCRTILGAHALILCGEVTLPDSPFVRFALQTMKAAGGAVICLGKQASDPDSILLPNGISAENIEILCRKATENE